MIEQLYHFFSNCKIYQNVAKWGMGYQFIHIMYLPAMILTTFISIKHVEGQSCMSRKYAKCFTEI